MHFFFKIHFHEFVEKPSYLSQFSFFKVSRKENPGNHFAHAWHRMNSRNCQLSCDHLTHAYYMSNICDGANDFPLFWQDLGPTYSPPTFMNILPGQGPRAK